MALRLNFLFLCSNSQGAFRSRFARLLSAAVLAIVRNDENAIRKLAVFHEQKKRTILKSRNRAALQRWLETI